MHKLYLAALISILGYFCLSIVTLCSKLLGNEVSLFTILLFQNTICLLLTLPSIAKHGFSSLKTEQLGLHLARDFAGISSFFFLFLALKTIPLVNGTLLLNTGPLWLPFIAYIWLRVRIPNRLWIGLIIGFIGVILILKPAGPSFSFGSIAALLSGILLGFALLVLPRLRATEPTHRILFYYFLMGTLASILLTFIDFILPSSTDFILLLIIGVFTFVAQALVTYSFKFGSAATLAPLAYTVVVFSGIFDWLLWDNIPHFSTSLGILLVMSGAILSIHLEKKYQKSLSSQKP